MTDHPRFAVLLAGGGTAGHVAPLLATADALRERFPGLRVVALGTAEGLEATLVPPSGIDLRIIPRVPLPRRLSTDLFRLPARLHTAVDIAREVIDDLDETPDVDGVVVVGFGGYVAVPAYLAARRAGARIVVHEGNSRPGLANRLGARLTTYVATAFAGTPLPHATHLGMPLRRSLTTLDRLGTREEALRHFGLSARRRTILVTGGSLGAQRLNSTFAGAAPDLLDAGVQVVHVTGRGKSLDPAPPLPTERGGAAYVVVEYLDRMDLAYAAADVVVCRAGAGTVSELTALGLPGAYVPLPVGNGEQRLNAAPVVQAGGGLLVEDAACTPAWVRNELLPLVADQNRLAGMAESAARFGIRDGADRLCDLVATAAVGRTGTSQEGRAA